MMAALNKASERNKANERGGNEYTYSGGLLRKNHIGGH
jgi:hypothetical protein